MGLLNDVIVNLVYYYSWALIIYILMSWFPNARESKIGQFLARICEPYLDPFRRIIPSFGMIDISPIVAIFVLRFAVIGINTLFSFVS